MSEWKVSVQKIEIFPHPNADNLQIAKVGMFQLVIAKGNYSTNDLVVFAPKRSILPEWMRTDYIGANGQSYLSGKNHDRVSSMKLRGELSEGVTINKTHLLDHFPDTELREEWIDQDFSSLLGIELYEPPIPIEMAGQVQKLSISKYRQHDVESMVIYENEFVAGEKILCTEKINGSQIAILRIPCRIHISSKGLLGKGQEILQSSSNFYWKAFNNIKNDLFDKIDADSIQVFGEAYPAQGQAWNYGSKVPTMKIFRIVVDGQEFNYIEELKDLWVPIIYRGPFDIDHLRTLAKGKEQVSGKELHKREGIVVSPIVPRRSKEGFALYTKLIADNFKQSDDELS